MGAFSNIYEEKIFVLSETINGLVKELLQKDVRIVELESEVADLEDMLSSIDKVD